MLKRPEMIVCGDIGLSPAWEAVELSPLVWRFPFSTKQYTCLHSVNEAVNQGICQAMMLFVSQ
jgi:hypothetical protein